MHTDSRRQASQATQKSAGLQAPARMAWPLWLGSRLGSLEPDHRPHQPKTRLGLVRLGTCYVTPSTICSSTCTALLQLQASKCHCRLCTQQGPHHTGQRCSASCLRAPAVNRAPQRVHAAAAAAARHAAAAALECTRLRFAAP